MNELEWKTYKEWRAVGKQVMGAETGTWMDGEIKFSEHQVMEYIQMPGSRYRARFLC